MPVAATGQVLHLGGGNASFFLYMVQCHYKNRILKKAEKTF